jgi:hypothetical protein
MSWETDAACAHPDCDPQWWDTAAPLRAQQRALAICAGCPVADPCRRQADLQRPVGVIQAGQRWRHHIRRTSIPLLTR